VNPRRLTAALCLGLLASLGLATTALGHPLGNYTVNRAVAVTVGPDGIGVRYVIDMAEIPAFAALQLIDSDEDGNPEPLEERGWADATCAAASAGLAVTVDGRRLKLASSATPTLTFPPGVGGLETLRLECPIAAEWTAAVGDHAIDVLDSADDGHIGWREATIAASGWTLLSSTVPAASPTNQLRAYPTDSLVAPADIRSATGTFRVGDAPALPAPAAGAAPAAPRSATEDPLAELLAGDLTLPVALLSLLIAGGLGAAHALSPGHGKTLVAAYLLGSGGTLRQAAGLGLTVAVTHTLGVFALGAATLAAGELFVPERVVVWLSVASGALVALLGIGLIWRSLRSARRQAPHDHSHGHHADHHHPQGHEHVENPSSGLRTRSIVALGLAGGLVPSASALIVLLAAVSTGRLLFGVGLIVAFGVGMAVVLAGLAAATTVARRAIVDPRGVASWWLARRVSTLLPFASGVAVLAIGSAVTLAALGRIG
jgi:ABC-type nickel/cobalt efflux system permease component RcnA